MTEGTSINYRLLADVSAVGLAVLVIALLFTGTLESWVLGLLDHIEFYASNRMYYQLQLEYGFDFPVYWAAASLTLALAVVLGTRLPLLDAVLWVLGTHAVLAFLVACFYFLNYPFCYDFWESVHFEHAARLSRGQHLYAPASPEFVPLLYNPFYYWVAGWLLHIVPFRIESIRLLSMLTTFLTSGVLFAWFGRRQGWLMGFLAGALYISGYEYLAGYFALVRGDNMGILMLAVGMYLLCRNRPVHWEAAGVLALYLGVWSKQSFVLWAVGVLVAYAFHAGPRAFAWLAGFLAAHLGTGWWMDATSDGWYSIYTVRVPFTHVFEVESPLELLRDELAITMGWLWVTLLLAAVVTRRDADAEEGGFPWRRIAPWGIIFTGAFAASAASKLKVGNFPNAMMPVFLVGIVLFFAVAPRLREQGMEAFAKGILALTFVRFFFVPMMSLPHPLWEDVNRNAVRELRTIARAGLLLDNIPYWRYLLDETPPQVFATIANHEAFRAYPDRAKYRFIREMIAFDGMVLYANGDPPQMAAYGNLFHLDLLGEIPQAVGRQSPGNNRFLYRLRLKEGMREAYAEEHPSEETLALMRGDAPAVE